ncbi:MAG TPA: sigma-70 family RNA polymerase sigma factor, partial [Myxococcota bacterium]|nr:sigma-70 family RNA polymerase sigma factor [Myxococcota bacterium]
FAVQKDVRAPWRRYLDELAPLRPELHRFCARLTGSAFEGEDLVQEALLRVFGQLGKLDADVAKLEHPRAYLVRTATRIWIDAQRRRGREQEILAEEARQEAAARSGDPARGAELRDAAAGLLGQLAPRERAALVMKDVLDLSLEQTAEVLHTTVPAVKSALQRGRGRLAAGEGSAAAVPAPSRALVERFLAALARNDLAELASICSADLGVELVGGAELDGFERARPFFAHAHLVLPIPGFGTDPRWELAELSGEPIVLGFRKLDGFEGLNEIHRIQESDGKIVRIRCYCFCPDTLRAVAAELGIAALRKPYRSPP